MLLAHGQFLHLFMFSFLFMLSDWRLYCVHIYSFAMVFEYIISLENRSFGSCSTLCFISWVSDQNGVSLLYIMLEINNSGQEPSI